MNNENNCLLLINKLPIELIQYIKSYLTPNVLLLLNKSLYDKYHFCIKSNILNVKKQYDNYVRDTIRRDNFFVFTRILRECLKQWLNYKNYYYKDKIYMNYLYFLRDYCCINESNNCRNIIDQHLFETGLSKNQHKKNLVKIIKRKWMN
jgi:hypothetical protein